MCTLQIIIIITNYEINGIIFYINCQNLTFKSLFNIPFQLVLYLYEPIYEYVKNSSQIQMQFHCLENIETMSQC